tara:strand:+ start:330 stop:914 length:585 start_codon:yes stop_codon:yes gene_type:complete
MPNTTTTFAEMTPAQREKAGTKKEIADQYEELLAAQSPILSKLDLRKQKADFTTVGLINFAKPGTRRDGSIISPNLFVAPIRESVDIFLGDGDYQKVKVRETWFDFWNNGTEAEPNPVGDQIMELVDTTEFAVVRLYWEWYSKKDDIMTRDILDQDGQSIGKQEKYLRYDPSKKVFAFDVLTSKPKEASTIADF